MYICISTYPQYITKLCTVIYLTSWMIGIPTLATQWPNLGLQIDQQAPEKHHSVSQILRALDGWHLPHGARLSGTKPGVSGISGKDIFGIYYINAILMQ